MVEAAIGPIIIGIALGAIVIVNLPKETIHWDPSQKDIDQVKKQPTGGKPGDLPKPVSMKEIDAANKDKNAQAKTNNSGQKEPSAVKINVEEDKRLTDEVIEMIQAERNFGRQTLQKMIEEKTQDQDQKVRVMRRVKLMLDP